MGEFLDAKTLELEALLEHVRTMRGGKACSASRRGGGGHGGQQQQQQLKRELSSCNSSEALCLMRASSFSSSDAFVSTGCPSPVESVWSSRRVLKKKKTAWLSARCVAICFVKLCCGEYWLHVAHRVCVEQQARPFFFAFFFVSIGQTEQHIFIYYFTAWLSARCIGMYSLKQALYPPQAHCAASDEQPQHILRKPRAFFFFCSDRIPRKRAKRL